MYSTYNYPGFSDFGQTDGTKRKKMEGKDIKVKKRYGVLLILSLFAALVLAACGDNTATSKPAATTYSGGSMPGMTMKSGETMGASATTAAAAMTTAASGSTTTAAAGATTAAMGSMPGMTQAVNTTMLADDPMTNSLKGLSGKEFEISFMQQMIVHHQSAIDMAKLIPTNTKRPELVKLGQDIISAQTKEISYMTGWLASWHNAKPVADSMSVPGMMQMMGDIDKLKNAKDTQFDELFMRMMIQHHQQAVNMANLIPSKTQRPELVKLSQDIIKAQTTEIEQMMGWQKAWGLKA